MMSRDASFWYALPNVAMTLDNATDNPSPPVIRRIEPLLTDVVILAVSEASLFSRIFDFETRKVAPFLINIT